MLFVAKCIAIEKEFTRRTQTDLGYADGRRRTPSIPSWWNTVPRICRKDERVAINSLTSKAMLSITLRPESTFQTWSEIVRNYGFRAVSEKLCYVRSLRRRPESETMVLGQFLRNCRKSTFQTWSEMVSFKKLSQRALFKPGQKWSETMVLGKCACRTL